MMHLEFSYFYFFEINKVGTTGISVLLKLEKK